MLTIGDRAPAFDCSAVVAGEVVELAWDQVYDGGALVLQFDSVEGDAVAPDGLAALMNAAGRFDDLQAKVAVVCRDHPFDVLQWVDRLEDSDAGELAVPMILDPDDAIASLYDMVAGDGCTAWGFVIIGPDGRVRQFSVSSSRVGTDVDELLRCVTSISLGRC